MSHSLIDAPRKASLTAVSDTRLAPRNRGQSGSTGTKLPEILILGMFPFPVGTAGSNVMLCFGKALRAAGFSVGFVTEEDGRREDRQADGSYAFQDFPYFPLGKRPLSTLNELTGRRSLFLEWLRQNLNSQVQCVFAYSGASAFLIKLRHLCRARRVRLVGIVAEFYDWRHFSLRPGMALSILDSELNRRVANRLIGTTISLSRHLDRYYRERGVESLLLPPLIDLKEPRWGGLVRRPDPTIGNPLRLLFSGTVIRDRQEVMLKALRNLRDRGHPVRMEYCGVTREQVCALRGVGQELVEGLGDAVVFHGRLGSDRLNELIRQVDFGVLMRDDARWSRACFPSKVPEFLASGTPMLCNLSSDLGDYLTDGDNSIIVPEVNVDAFAAAVVRALKLDPARRSEMRRRARQTAEEFHAPRHAGVLAEFLSRIGVKARLP